ncbi:MAG: hypothetical protein IPL46_05775 [Saprospiraceae bacterium]|nr:hypothetical protein [Saprospiraceae bacterium]
MPISLVSQYESKPAVLVNLIVQLQHILLDHFGEAFKPYQLEQVHGTIIGIETILMDGQHFSKWCMENEGKAKPINTELLRDFFREKMSSFLMKIGGYQQEVDYGFRSRGTIPFERSFSIQSNRAVINGWPIMKIGESARYSDALVNLRNQFKSINLCHKWNIDGYQDNDFFLVLGKIEQKTTDHERLRISCEHIRRYLAEHETYFNISSDSLSLVEYEYPELPRDTTKILNIRKVDWSKILSR